MAVSMRTNHNQQRLEKGALTFCGGAFSYRSLSKRVYFSVPVDLV